MRGLFLAVGLMLSGLSFAQGGPPPVPAQAPSAPTTFVAQGEVIEIPEAGFTIVPPVGWEVLRNTAGASLLFQTPKVEGAPGVVTFQSNLRVMVINEPRPIDDSTKEEYSKIIVEKNSALGGISNYSIRSADKVALQSGSEGYLWYTEFTLNSIPMMQMHILVSSASKHFLMTYTDLATVFEAENSPLLTTAYTSMQGAKVDSKPPDRFASFYVAGGVILAILVLLVFVRVLRGYKMKRLGERLESDDGSDSSSSRDDDDDDDVSGIAELSSMDRHGEGDDDHEMPETREAMRPVPKAKKPEVVLPPATVRPAPVPQKAPVPSRPAPQAPVVAPRREFEEETFEKTTSNGKAAKNQPTSDSGDEDDAAGSWAQEASDVSEIRPKAPVTAKKAKPQKVANPAKMKDIAPEDGSEVARLSEILPNTGDTKKKKGFFGFGKGKDQDRDDDEESMEAPRKKSKKDEPPMSEVAGWNLKSDGTKSRHEENDDDD